MTLLVKVIDPLRYVAARSSARRSHAAAPRTQAEQSPGGLVLRHGSGTRRRTHCGNVVGIHYAPVGLRHRPRAAASLSGRVGREQRS